MILYFCTPHGEHVIARAQTQGEMGEWLKPTVC